MAKSKKARRAGRPRDPDAKRHQTTRAGRASDDRPTCACCGLPTSLTVRKRIAATGEGHVGLDFPLDVLKLLGLITDSERDEGLRFAQLSWWLYGLPFAGPELLYERVVSGFVDVDLAPRRELHVTLDDPDAAREEAERIARNKRRYEKMVDALRRAGPNDLVLNAVKAATQMLQMPKFALVVGTPDATPATWYDMARLKKGLAVLVRPRDAEDRYLGRGKKPK